MKNWLLPIAVLGLSGIGLVCASRRGRRKLHVFFDHMTQGRDPLGELDNAIEGQLDTIQRALDHLSQALESPR